MTGIMMHPSLWKREEEPQYPAVRMASKVKEPRTV
jgi:hypothetical protein